MANLIGKVVWFNNSKGFGFLTQPHGPEVFCHFSSILGDGYKSLKEGDLVDFDIIQGQKGLQADKVRRLETVTGRTVKSLEKTAPDLLNTVEVGSPILGAV